MGISTRGRGTLGVHTFSPCTSPPWRPGPGSFPAPRRVSRISSLWALPRGRRTASSTWSCRTPRTFAYRRRRNRPWCPPGYRHSLRGWRFGAWDGQGSGSGARVPKGAQTREKRPRGSFSCAKGRGGGGGGSGRVGTHQKRARLGPRDHPTWGASSARVLRYHLPSLRVTRARVRVQMVASTIRKVASVS